VKPKRRTKLDAPLSVDARLAKDESIHYLLLRYAYCQAKLQLL